jgi:uncharacterized DUF497 family protein
MRYGWDPLKDALNLRKHGLRLADGVDALEDPHRDSWLDNEVDYGEERIITLGLSNGRVLFVVSTLRAASLTRIISVRKAENSEIEQYGLGRS